LRSSDRLSESACFSITGRERVETPRVFVAGILTSTLAESDRFETAAKTWVCAGRENPCRRPFRLRPAIVESGRLPVMTYCLPDLAEGGEGDREIVMLTGIVWLEPHRLRILNDGLLYGTAASQRHAEIV